MEYPQRISCYTVVHFFFGELPSGNQTWLAGNFPIYIIYIYIYICIQPSIHSGCPIAWWDFHHRGITIDWILSMGFLIFHTSVINIVGWLWVVWSICRPSRRLPPSFGASPPATSCRRWGDPGDDGNGVEMFSGGFLSHRGVPPNHPYPVLFGTMK